MGEKPTEADERKAKDEGRPTNAEQRAGAALADPAGAGADPDSGGGIAIDEEGVQRGAMNSIQNMKARSAGGRKDEAQRTSNLNLSKSNINRESGAGSDDPGGIAVSEEGVPEDNRSPKPN